jgi:hypothetical protein
MQSADKGQTAHGSDLHLFRGHVWRGSVERHDEVKDKMSAVVKALRSILALHPETALLTFCTGTLGYFHGVLMMLPNCVAAQMPEHGGWPMAQALRFSFEGSRGVGRPKVGTDWCGNVKSITEQIQHT